MVLTRNEVEHDIHGKGDFVQIDHLKRFLARADNSDVKKFILLKLAGIHESHNFIADAARCIEAAADVALSEKEKKELYMKEVELLVKSEQFELADKALVKASSFAMTRERQDIQNKYVEMYRSLGMQMERGEKQRKALAVYQKLYSLNQPVEKKTEVRKKMMDIYYKMGNLAEYNRLKDRQDAPVEVKKEEPEDIMDEIGVKRWDRWGFRR